MGCAGGSFGALDKIAGNSFVNRYVQLVNRVLTFVEVGFVVAVYCAAKRPTREAVRIVQHVEHGVQPKGGATTKRRVGRVLHCQHVLAGHGATFNKVGREIVASYKPVLARVKNKV